MQMRKKTHKLKIVNNCYELVCNKKKTKLIGYK